ncbi:DUF421 domain-containing protein [Luteolibacter sp. AS25]|uniref:DUF421 domain-containing protein n=1 Tax=Luteolibacter sp. AS25 TaxID=3135776 RepID=UPI00398A73EB
MFLENPFFDTLLRILILGPTSLLWIVVVVRFVGLRSFSKMTAFDFITTVATGSLLANAATATSWSSFLVADFAVLALLGTQAIIAHLRLHDSKLLKTIENEPLLLMLDGEIIHRNLKQSRVSDSDLYAKLREANVLHLSEVRAVVLETTGDISVLHGDSLSQELIASVRRHA